MPARTALAPRLYFSYSQFLVYDQGVRAPGCVWTNGHSLQGFARRESTVCFATLLEFGHAEVSCSRSPFRLVEPYDRVIAVPFLVSTGKVVVDGPEETGVARAVELPAGNYRLVSAQRVVNDEEEVIDLYFELLDEALLGSHLLLVDGLLNPPIQLIETAEVG